MATALESDHTPALPLPDHAGISESSMQPGLRSLARQAAAAPEVGQVAVEIVIPVYNEEHGLSASVTRLHQYLTDHFPLRFRITIADNASTDGTWPLALAIANRFDQVRAVHLERKGRGRALRAVWMGSAAPVVAYMDVDLSTDLAALLPLVAPLLSGHSDVAIGSRLGHGARVVRGIKRDTISRCYNLLLRTTMHAQFSDAQCGFKAMRTETARWLLPLVRDDNWFFDTEMLVLAEHAGLRIHEVPVDWIDDPDSSVDIVATAMEDLRGMARVSKRLRRPDLALTRLREQQGRGGIGALVAPTLMAQIARFAGIGVVSTLTYLALFAILAGPLGSQAANFLALLITAVANTAANRRITFGIRGAQNRTRGQLEGIAVFATGLVLTSGALGVLQSADSPTPRSAELLVLVVANLVVTVGRFVAMRMWIFHPRRSQTGH